MIHRMTHRHAIAAKPGLGQILICSTRISGRVKGIWYRTPLVSAQWIKLPVDTDVYVRVLKSDSYFEAVAHIRRAWDEAEA